MRAFFISVVLATGVGASTASAQDVALIFGNERYESLGRVARAADVLSASPVLEDFGFVVTSLPNGRADAVQDALAGFIGQVPTAERLVVALSGRFVTDGGRTWFLTAEAEDTGLLGLGDTALSLDSLMQVLATAPGHALLILGADEGDTGPIDQWLRLGIGSLDIPQGVTVLQGDPRYTAEFMQSEMALPEGDLTGLVGANRRITASGYLPRRFPFMPPEQTESVDEVVAPAILLPDVAAEDALWQGAQALDTVDAYRNYLRRYPTGRYAEAAETAIGDIVAEPERDSRLSEDVLGLSLEQRRNIQRHLSLLEYDTRGIDGIFGSGTRGAIGNWQQENGFSATTYLTAEQINLLDAQASRRSAELEAEAERRRIEQARMDRAFWDETGAQNDEPGYRAYLERFPDGLFAEEATARLSVIEEEKRLEAEAEDRAAWDRATETDTAAGFEQYLQAFPGGVFQAEAEARIASFVQEETDADGVAAARAEEERLGLNPLTARLVEVRLDQLGLEPGEVDGQFDEATRRALRRYQSDRDLDVTGYLNEPTVVRLLADSINLAQ